MGARRRAGLPPLPPPPPPIRAPLYFSESASLPPSGRVFLQLRPGGRDSRRPLTPQPGAGKLSAAARTARLRSAARRLLRSGRASPRARPVLHLAGSPQHPGLWRPAPTQISSNGSFYDLAMLKQMNSYKILYLNSFLLFCSNCPAPKKEYGKK